MCEYAEPSRFIKVNRDIHKGKRINIVFYILHILAIVDNNPITLLGDWQDYSDRS